MVGGQGLFFPTNTSVKRERMTGRCMKWIGSFDAGWAPSVKLSWKGVAIPFRTAKFGKK